MKITRFCPIIITKDPDSVIKLYEDLGFEKRHTKTDVEGGANVAVTMKDTNGFSVIVAKSENVPKDLTGIQINVDNFQEAYDFLISRGFVNPRGDKVTETSSSKATMLFSPSGFAINIDEHIKN
jgi:hypothetical protein